ncbi:MAG: hypothetical protein MOB07_14380 [Acidobacteria bacterium]|nr:hypothetical protein [Acidobacteriota bacterium]
MKTLKHFIAILLCISLCAPLTQAQTAQDKQQDPQANNPIAQDVLIIIQQEKVRFTAQKAIQELRLQIFDQTGELIYDSGAVTEPELSWSLQGANGETVKSGLYAYTLSIKEVGKESGAETARMRRGHFIVDRARERDGQTDRLWITSHNDSGVGTELTVARNEGVTIAGTSATSEHKSVKLGDNAQPKGEAEAKTKSEKSEKSESVTKDAALAPAAVTGKTTIQGPEDPLLEINHTGTSGHPSIWFKQDGAAKAYLWWDRVNNRFNIGTHTTNPILTLLNNGNVGIGTTNPTSKLEIAAQDGLRITGYQPFLSLKDTNAGGRHGGIQSVNGDLLFIPHSFSGQPPWAAMIVRDSANVGSRVDIYAQDALNMVGYQPFLTLTDSNAGWARTRIQNVNGGINFQTHDLTVAGGSAMYIQNGTQNIGIGTAAPQARLHVQGTTMTSVLQITGGADFAENFEVNIEKAGNDTTTPKVEAGMVVSLDPASPGKLALSTQAYDRRVAGIISGAGGVKPGMIMSQEGTLADGKHPVALSGRVYCWVDASQGAIEVGDLLTTSSTPGHAMRAADAVKAQGAIIGKAMTSLREGKGLVLVLVTLQ